MRTSSAYESASRVSFRRSMLTRLGKMYVNVGIATCTLIPKSIQSSRVCNDLGPPATDSTGPQATPSSLLFAGLAELGRALRRDLDRTRDRRAHAAVLEREEARDRASAGRCVPASAAHHARAAHALVTASLSCAGCAPVSVMRAAPWSVCAASSSASARGRPIITPPSASASRNTHANAGPDPESAVHASKCFSSRKRTRPTELNTASRIDRSAGRASEITVMPSRICARVSARRPQGGGDERGRACSASRGRRACSPAPTRPSARS
jgi:hypothetical protein